MTGPGGRIEGTAHLPDGTPIVEARVFFMSAPVPTPDIAQLTDEAGRFTLWAPAHGMYEIACHADGFLPETAPVDVTSEASRIEIDFELTPTSD